MTSVFRIACFAVMIAMMVSTPGCRKKQVVVAAPDQAAVEEFLAARSFGADGTEVSIVASGISELAITNVVALENDIGNARVEFVHTSGQGTWRLEGRLVYILNAGKTQCRSIEFSEPVALDAAANAGESAASTAPAQ